MKLLLTSAGFRTEDLVAACVRLCGKPRGKINFAVINEGYAAEPGDKRWMFDQLSGTAELFPGEFDLVNLLALSREQIKVRLAAKDVILVLGGHTDYLMSVFQKSGFATLLPELLEAKVYVGSSAGSMILGERVSAAAYQQIYGEHADYDVSAYMGLVHFAINPHFGSPDFPHNTTEVLRELSQSYNGRIFGLSDTQGIVINGKKTQYIGGQPYCVSAGKVIRL